MIILLLQGIQGNESPKHKNASASEKTTPGSNVDSHVQLKYENDRLKLALAQRQVHYCYY